MKTQDRQTQALQNLYLKLAETHLCGFTRPTPDAQALQYAIQTQQAKVKIR